jgi:S1-C subfamily serine protease
MLKRVYLLATLCAVLSISRPIDAQLDVEFNTAMMDATIQIGGPSTAAGKETCGSGFFIGGPSRQTPEGSQYTFVTAAHVFERIGGDLARFAIRLKQDDQIVRTVVTVPIRKSGIRLYAKHPNADISVMRVTLPNNNAHSMVTWPALATDEVFTKLGIHPGDEMFAVGYPLCRMANPQGYPMLRRGALATSTHVPGAVLTSFFLDVPTFEGNSGGPVFFDYSDRTTGGVSNRGEVHRYIAGVVSQQMFGLNEPLLMAGVVPAKFIAEAVKLLPSSGQ